MYGHETQIPLNDAQKMTMQSSIAESRLSIRLNEHAEQLKSNDTFPHWSLNKIVLNGANGCKFLRTAFYKYNIFYTHILILLIYALKICHAPQALRMLQSLPKRKVRAWFPIRILYNLFRDIDCLVILSIRYLKSNWTKSVVHRPDNRIRTTSSTQTKL